PVLALVIDGAAVRSGSGEAARTLALGGIASPGLRMLKFGSPANADGPCAPGSATGTVGDAGATGAGAVGAKGEPSPRCRVRKRMPSVCVLITVPVSSSFTRRVGAIWAKVGRRPRRCATSGSGRDTSRAVVA